MIRSTISRQARRFRLLAVDVTPLRTSRDFRLLWIGELVSETGSQMALVAVYVQVFALTNSVAAVGLVGLVQLVPLALGALVGGPIIDVHDRRRLLFVAQGVQVGASAVLLAGALLDRPPLAMVYLGAALVAGGGGFSLSIRSAMTPNLVGAGQLPSALALNQVLFHTTLIVGPAIGGLVIDQVGFAWAYGIDLLSFAATIAACLLMRPQVPARSGPGDSVGSGRGPAARGPIARGWAQTTAGFRYLRGRPVLQSIFTVDLVAMVFGMPRALFPVLAVVEFDGGAQIVGLLFSAVSVGALVGALGSGWVHRIRHQGQAVLWSVAVWGAAIVGFGLARGTLWIAMASLAVAGAADVVSAVFRGTILQTNVPDSLRGRMSAINILVVTGGPRLGDVEAGVVASLTSPTASVVAGGALCIVGVVVLALAVPDFVRYRAPD